MYIFKENIHIYIYIYIYIYGYSQNPAFMEILQVL